MRETSRTADLGTQGMGDEDVGTQGVEGVDVGNLGSVPGGPCAHVQLGSRPPNITGSPVLCRPS